MKETHRAYLVTWMIVVSSRSFEFHDETVFLAVNVLDRVLARTSVSADCFQLLALVSLLIAAKMVRDALFSRVLTHTSHLIISLFLAVCVCTLLRCL